MPSTAAITAVATRTRTRISPKDLRDYTRQHAGGGTPTEDTGVTNAMAEGGIGRANFYLKFGGGFNENNEIHLEAATIGTLIVFFDYIKNFDASDRYERKLSALGKEYRTAKRTVVSGSGRIDYDADDRELGEDFVDTFRRQTGDDES